MTFLCTSFWWLHVSAKISWNNFDIYSMHFNWIKLFIHDTKKCTSLRHKYSLKPLLYVSASFTSSSESSTRRFKTDHKISDYKSNSYYITAFLQLMLTMYVSQPVIKTVQTCLNINYVKTIKNTIML